MSVAVYELSRLLNTGLDRETLAILMALIQKGVNPEALAAVVKDLRKDAASASTQSAVAAATTTTERTFTGKQPLSQQDQQVSQVRFLCILLSRLSIRSGRRIEDSSETMCACVFACLPTSDLYVYCSRRNSEGLIIERKYRDELARHLIILSKFYLSFLFCLKECRVRHLPLRLLCIGISGI